MSTGVSAQDVEKTVKEHLPGIQHLEVIDESGGCGAKFSLVIVTPHFENMGLLERHRLVNDTLKEEMKKIHALSMKTWTPKQWETKK